MGVLVRRKVPLRVGPAGRGLVGLWWGPWLLASGGCEDVAWLSLAVDLYGLAERTAGGRPAMVRALVGQVLWDCLLRGELGRGWGTA